MSRYEKGANFERELVNKFYEHGWTAMRAAGSGSIMAPDVVGMKNGKIVIIECKATKQDRLSLKDAILNMKKISEISGAKAYIAVKFYKEKPRFFDVDKLMLKENFTISLNDTYLSFDALVGRQRTL
jgi:Holliday junction resolvase